MTARTALTRGGLNKCNVLLLPLLSAQIAPPAEREYLMLVCESELMAELTLFCVLFLSNLILKLKKQNKTKKLNIETKMLIGG